MLFEANTGNPGDPWAIFDQTKKTKPFGLQIKMLRIETYFTLKELHNSLSL